MKKQILFFISALFFINVQAQQCNSNPILVSGSGGTVNFADSSTINSGWSTNYSVSYLWDFRDGSVSTQQNPCHTFGDLSNLTSNYVTLTITYFDSTTFNYCQDIDRSRWFIWRWMCNLYTKAKSCEICY